MRHIRLWAALALAAIAVPFVIFFMRPPALVVTDALFAALYGNSRLRREQVSASIALFRRVKPVKIADGAGFDVLILEITKISARPWCVLFAHSQTAAALRYHEQFPETPVILLTGLAVSGLPPPDGLLYVYTTDRETDLYRAGLCAGILGSVPQKPVQKAQKPPETAALQDFAPKTYVLWQDSHVQAVGRDLFSRGVREQAPDSDIIFANSSAEMPDIKKIACVALTGAGSEYLEKNLRMPLILFSWLDPSFTAREIAVLFDDSVWALAPVAVRMAALRQTEGKIPSKPLIFRGKIADNSVFRALKKAAKKMP